MVECAVALAADEASPQSVQCFLRAARAFGQLLRDHIFKEDRVLFPMVARHLPAEKDAELLAAMQQCCPPGVRPGA
jgi:hemerythrin-like domain-containing protein